MWLFNFLNSLNSSKVTYKLLLTFFALLTNGISSYLADATQRKPRCLLLSSLFIFRGNC